VDPDGAGAHVGASASASAGAPSGGEALDPQGVVHHVHNGAIVDGGVHKVDPIRAGLPANPGDPHPPGARVPAMADAEGAGGSPVASLAAPAAAGSSPRDGSVPAAEQGGEHPPRAATPAAAAHLSCAPEHLHRSCREVTSPPNSQIKTYRLIRSDLINITNIRNKYIIILFFQ